MEEEEWRIFGAAVWGVGDGFRCESVQEVYPGTVTNFPTFHLIQTLAFTTFHPVDDLQFKLSSLNCGLK